MSKRLKLGKAFIGLAILMFSSCAEKSLVGTHKLAKLKTTRLLEHLDSLANTDWSFFYTRIATKYSSSTTKVSFKTILKVKRDSVVNATITFASIPIFNILLDPDTLKVVNKKDKCYTIETVDYLKEEFDFPFGYPQVQELLLGQPLAWDKEEHLKQIENPDYYVVTTSKSRFQGKKKTGKDIDITYFLTPSTLDIERITIDSPEDTTSILLNYEGRDVIDNLRVPQKAEVYIYTPRDTIFVELKYQKAEFEKEKSIFFVIPEQYDRCK